eukprot:SAG11_NODE_901_length_6623_cov_3.043225_2_plen_167_part_00
MTESVWLFKQSNRQLFPSRNHCRLPEVFASKCLMLMLNFLLVECFLSLLYTYYRQTKHGLMAACPMARSHYNIPPSRLSLLRKLSSLSDTKKTVCPQTRVLRLRDDGIQHKCGRDRLHDNRTTDGTRVRIYTTVEYHVVAREGGAHVLKWRLYDMMSFSKESQSSC